MTFSKDFHDWFIHSRACFSIDIQILNDNVQPASRSSHRVFHWHWKNPGKETSSEVVLEVVATSTHATCPWFQLFVPVACCIVDCKGSFGGWEVRICLSRDRGGPAARDSACGYGGRAGSTGGTLRGRWEVQTADNLVWRNRDFVKDCYLEVYIRSRRRRWTRRIRSNSLGILELKANTAWSLI